MISEKSCQRQFRIYLSGAYWNQRLNKESNKIWNLLPRISFPLTHKVMSFPWKFISSGFEQDQQLDFCTKWLTYKRSHTALDEQFIYLLPQHHTLDLSLSMMTEKGKIQIPRLHLWLGAKNRAYQQVAWAVAHQLLSAWVSSSDFKPSRGTLKTPIPFLSEARRRRAMELKFNTFLRTRSKLKIFN